MYKWIAFCLIFISSSAWAQYKITGRVVDSADNKPIPGATVFLANASVATSASADGNFSLDNVRGGQYELVVSMVGYNSYHKVILVNNDITLPMIFIAEKINTLNEVSIRPDPDWERNYEAFRGEFLGRSDFAKDCKIVNPETLNIHYDKVNFVLTATSFDFVMIDNNALGYRIKYKLDTFTRDFHQGIRYYAGTASFEKMKGKPSQERRWQKNRMKAYEGSSMQFLRTLIAGDVAERGFKVLRLIRKPNPDYKGFGNRYIDGLVTKPLTPADYVKRTNQKDLFALVFNDCLYVMYNGGTPVPEDGKNPTGIGWATTNIIFNKPYAVFDNNGVFTDPSSITFEGEWGKSSMAELLPVDFEPGLKK
ncbi:carboxypeptidase-like regulatory domain-containing protein [Mucilaginibacter ginsenosidivorans]|uniref:Carboxypeptidase-like regulatory domain-containing protein n=1 Tax=Mucilaginibacter ginsenosidivorans TaxID=398053 RepID=A0A5B8UUJ7_9SPHI|nr:carboxypeptidase-like regulatory domain-containing protein [Mucilaginibacter ginsenosidivorans]QEC62800.1 carboxypeptidase-like regulatory domain-containing protein [Mucilaginibacter ginsenosidivorans]